MKNHITSADVDAVAKLARLDLTVKEKQRTVTELEGILAYIDRLSSVDTEQVEPYAGAPATLSGLRDDVAGPFAERNALLSKDRFKDDLLVTKGVFTSAKGGSASGGKKLEQKDDAS